MVRVRIAPSPTGEDLHIGNAYTALINFVFAKKQKGKFIIRIEDTDRKRMVSGSEKRLLASLRWLGLEHDEGPDIGGPYKPYRQSERLDTYKQYAHELVKEDKAYYCFCSRERLAKVRKLKREKGLPPKYDRYCFSLSKKTAKKRAETEPYVIRMKIPSGKTSFDDIIRGKITIDNKNLDDQVLLKSDGYPTYHLAVVVDDHLMKISHVIRGDEWISSTPKHVLLYQFFSWKIPIYAHLPLLRNKDRSKLSKRRNPVWVSWYQKRGFLPEAILNYLSLMGWSHPKEKEIFTLDEFIEVFTLERIQPVGPIFDLEKLKWMNGEYIRMMQNTKLKAQISKFLEGEYSEDLIEKTVPLVKNRIKILSDYLPLCEFFFKRPTIYEKRRNKKWLKWTKDMLGRESQWQTDTLHKKMEQLAGKLGVAKSKLFMDIRITITGKKIGPPLFESMEILGKKETLARLKSALA